MTVYLAEPLPVNPGPGERERWMLPGWINARTVRQEIGERAYDLGVTHGVIVEIP